MPSVSSKFSAYSADDKQALKELKEYAESKTGKPVPLSDIISAVEPDMPTPDYLSQV